MATLESEILKGNPRLEEVAAGGRPIRPAPPHDDPEAVRRIQKALRRLGFNMEKSFPNGFDKEPDGKYGQETYLRVIEFQKQAFPNDPAQWDGRVGKLTLPELDKRLPKGGGQPPPPPPPPPTPTTKTITQPAGEVFEIVSRPDNPAKGDLDATARPLKANFIAQGRVKLARLQTTTQLHTDMLTELSGARSLGIEAFKRFKSNTTAGSDQRFPDLDKAVAASTPFQNAAKAVEARVLANLKAQFAAGNVDYHDLVTGTGPVRSGPVAASEPGKVTGRLLPSLDVDIFGYSLTSDPSLKIVIGSFQGAKVSIKNFKATIAPAGTPSTFDATLVFEYRDHFGVDDKDTEIDTHLHGTAGQVAFWVLQHERHDPPGNFPYVTVVVVERAISGTLSP